MDISAAPPAATPYVSMDGDQRKRDETPHYLIHAGMAFLMAGLILTVVMLAMHNGNSGTEVRVEFSRDNVKGHLGAGQFVASISVESTDVTVASSSSTTDHRNRALFQVEGDLLVTYSLKNDGDRNVFVVAKQTPLDEGDNDQPKENFLGSSSTLYYTGIITEEAGTFENFMMIPAGEAVSATLNIASTTVVSGTQGTADLVYTHALFVHDPESGTVEEFVIRSNTIDLTIKQAPGIPIDVPLPDSNSNNTQNRRRAASAGGEEYASVLQTASPAPYGNVPYWNYVCADDDNAHGFTYSSGPNKGSKVPCAGLKTYCDSVKSACPHTCGICGTSASAAANWNKPYEAKAYTNKDCDSGSGDAYWKKLDLLTGAEDDKRNMCANMLYCLQNPSNAACSDVVKKWFGVTGGALSASSNAANLATLKTGYTKICSATNYKYECTPTSNCKITFTLDGMSYKDYPQDQISETVAKKFVKQCHEGSVTKKTDPTTGTITTFTTTGCSYSGTTAWVSSSETNPRVVNLCPLGFWIQSDEIGGTTKKSKASTIFHELSHFNDLAGTDDLQYNDKAQLDEAVSSPWGYINNADTWGNMADSTEGGSHTWADFKNGNIPPSPPKPAPKCKDTTNGAKDSYGDGCDEYAAQLSWCGQYDSKTFKSKMMCCCCGGGSI